MTDLEKAARMALKTLEYIDLQDNDRDFLSYKECHDLDDAITALRQAINNNVEQPAQQEPVAWVREHELPLAPGDAFSWVETFVHKTPLYTTPQRKSWAGLTDDELEIINDCGDTDSYKFARAIEAKLKEKNIK